MRTHRAAKQIEVIAAFEKRNDAALRVFLGEAQNFLCHLGEVGIFEHETAQRIAAMGIEAGGNDDEIRLKPASDFL
jgi:hypothetical protein